MADSATHPTMFPRRLMFCGGGVRVIGHVGVLEELAAELVHIREYCGVSAGALLAMCLAVGYTLAEVREFILGFDFTNVMDTASAPGLLLNFGIDTGERLQRMVEACIRVKGISGEITFSQLKRGLRVYATNLNTAELVEFSVAKTPGFRVADAVRASMSFPYYFQPYRDEVSGHYYGDGGIISNYPMFTLTEAEREETIGLLFREDCRGMEDLDFTSFIVRPIVLNMAARAHSEARAWGRLSIVTDMGGVGPLDFDIEKEAKEALLVRGREAAVAWKGRRLPKPARRFSCG